MLFTKRRCKIGNAKKKIFFTGLFLVVLLALASCSKLRFGSEGTPSAPPDNANSIKVGQTCSAGLLLDNSGNCIVPPCPAGSARDNAGKCVLINPNANPGFTPLPTETDCVPTGYFKSAYAYHKKNIGDSSSIHRGAPISYQFVVTNSCTANFYIEAGILPKTGGFTILVTQPSACDGNPHFAGKFVQGSKDTIFAGTQAGIIDAAFFPQDYNKAGLYALTAGVYTGCLKDGGKTIAEVPLQMINIGNYPDSDITASITKII